MARKKSKAPSKKRSEKGLSKFFLNRLWVLLVLAVLFVTLFSFHRKSTIYNSQPVKHTHSSTQVITYTSTSLPWQTFAVSPYGISFATAKQETFSLPSYGVSFSLPAVTEGRVTNNYHQNRTTVVSDDNNLDPCNQYGNFYQDDYLSSSYEVAVEIRVPMEKLSDAMEEYARCVKPIDHPHSNILPQTMVINGNSVVVVIDTHHYIYTQYIFVKNGIAYIFDFSNNVQTPGGGQVQQILDSVKFSQPTIVLPK